MPKLVNRGAAGLLSSIKPGQKPIGILPTTLHNGMPTKVDHFAGDLGLLPLVPVAELVYDPNNARLHPERNMDSIKQSLSAFGQRTPLVVNRRTGHVEKGNGTLRAATELGWTKLAVNWVDDDEATAAAYGLADNRTAEFAKWDFKVVATLDKLIAESSLAGCMPGWSTDELEVLRATDWTDVPAGHGDIGNGEQGPPANEEVDRAPGDAELLMKLGVTIADPTTVVEDGQVWRVGPHLLVVADVVREVAVWLPLLQPDMLFAPHPGPLLPLTLAAAQKSILMVQPSRYIAGHLLDHYKEIYGEQEVALAKVTCE